MALKARTRRGQYKAPDSYRGCYQDRSTWGKYYEHAPKIEINGEWCGAVRIDDERRERVPFFLIRSVANRFSVLWVVVRDGRLQVEEPMTPYVAIAYLQFDESGLYQVLDYSTEAEKFRLADATYQEFPSANTLAARRQQQRTLSQASLAEMRAQ